MISKLQFQIRIQFSLGASVSEALERLEGLGQSLISVILTTKTTGKQKAENQSCTLLPFGYNKRLASPDLLHITRNECL